MLERGGLYWVILLGLGLRLFHLGKEPFWLDEFAVWQAASAPDLGAALQVAKSHAAAMPLDYVVAWLVGRVTLTETGLRLTEVVWGTLTLPVAYHFFSRLSCHRTGLMAAALLAVSPIHVQYSQELRFYAPLCLAWLLSLLCLWRAILRPSRWSWLRFTLVGAVGICFHVYVALVVVTGLMWVLFLPNLGEGRDRGLPGPWAARLGLALSGLALAGVVLAALHQHNFVGPSAREFALWRYHTPAAYLLTGVGWWPPSPRYLHPPAVDFVFGYACLGLALLGIGDVLRREPRGPSALLLYAVALQMTFILGANWQQKYFAAPRQLLIFVPSALYFSARGMTLVAPRFRALPWLVLALALPVLHTYYLTPKTMVREILQVFHDRRSGQQLLLVGPEAELEFYRHYGAERWGSRFARDYIQPFYWGPGAYAQITEALFLVTQAGLEPAVADRLRRDGFSPLWLGPPALYGETLWHRPGNPYQAW